METHFRRLQRPAITLACPPVLTAPVQASTLTRHSVTLPGQPSGQSDQRADADAVLVDGDPSVRIEDLRRTALVIKGGVAPAPDALYRALGIQPFVAAVSVTPKCQPARFGGRRAARSAEGDTLCRGPADRVGL
jgi:hypothetical protein